MRPACVAPLQGGLWGAGGGQEEGKRLRRVCRGVGYTGVAARAAATAAAQGNPKFSAHIFALPLPPGAAPAPLTWRTAAA